MRDFRCYLAELLLGLALDLYPSKSIEQIELALFLHPFMKRRMKELEIRFPKQS